MLVLLIPAATWASVRVWHDPGAPEVITSTVWRDRPGEAFVLVDLLDPEARARPEYWRIDWTDPSAPAVVRKDQVDIDAIIAGREAQAQALRDALHNLINEFNNPADVRTKIETIFAGLPANQKETMVKICQALWVMVKYGR